MLVNLDSISSAYMVCNTSFHHYIPRDYQGNNHVVVNGSRTVEQTNDYYAYGGPWGNTSTNQGLQPFKYNGKELDRVHGLDWYDYGARRYDPAFAQFTQMDPLCEKYPHLSPYAYCAGNPVNAIDPKGDSICILNMGGGLNQHMALLIQNNVDKWAYYSFNGDKVYNKTLGLLGGGPINNMGNREFDSPQVFLDSDYNTEESNPKKQIINDEINGYGYKEGFVIPTTKEQDAIIRSTYQKNVKKGYNLLFNQCSQAVQKSLNAAGLRTTQSMWISTDPQSMHLFQIEVNPYFPSRAFNSIINNNPKGILYKKRK
jgi:RHS repeat-associated protein